MRQGALPLAVVTLPAEAWQNLSRCRQFRVQLHVFSLWRPHVVNKLEHLDRVDGSVVEIRIDADEQVPEKTVLAILAIEK